MPSDWNVTPGGQCANRQACVNPNAAWDDSQLVKGICPLCRRMNECPYCHGSGRVQYALRGDWDVCSGCGGKGTTGDTPDGVQPSAERREIQAPSVGSPACLWSHLDPILHALEAVLALNCRQYAQFRGYFDAAMEGVWDDDA